MADTDETQPLAIVHTQPTKNANSANPHAEGVAAFESEPFSEIELRLLGLDDGRPYYSIAYDHKKSIKYGMCSSFLASLAMIVLWPFWLLFSCCIYYGFKTHYHSRRA
eukprot:344774_1